MPEYIFGEVDHCAREPLGTGTVLLLRTFVYGVWEIMLKYFHVVSQNSSRLSTNHFHMLL
jgi:hypothetical protein